MGHWISAVRTGGGGRGGALGASDRSLHGRTRVADRGSVADDEHRGTERAQRPRRCQVLGSVPRQAVQNAVISAGFEELAVVLETALDDADPLGSLALAYRRYARQHPHLYRLMTEHPLQRERLAPGAEDRARRPALRAVRDDADLARALWAFVHGLTILELNDRFPPDADVDAAWACGLEAFRARLP
jgi:hypothetical protein